MRTFVTTVAFACPLLLHWAIVWESDVLLRSFLLLLALGVLYAGLQRRKIVSFGLAALVMAALAFWIDTQLTRAVAPIWPVFVYAGLAWLFGRTLRPGVVPLIERFARLEHPEGVPPDLPAYARRVNWVWTLFFAALAFATIVLAVLASTETLSLFTNIISWVLLVLLHLSEHSYRMWWRFPAITHKNPIKVVLSIVRHGPQLLL